MLGDLVFRKMGTAPWIAVGEDGAEPAQRKIWGI